MSSSLSKYSKILKVKKFLMDLKIQFVSGMSNSTKTKMKKKIESSNSCQLVTKSGSIPLESCIATKKL